MAASLSSHRSAESPPVYISVLNWNKADNTIRCLESLAQLDYPNYHVLVVDNASFDDSVERIRAAFPDIEILCSSENLGYAAGNLLALERAQQAGAELFWILNNDTIVEADSLTALVEAYQHHGPGLYGSVPLDLEKGTVGMSAWAIGSGNMPMYHQEQAVRWGASFAESFPDMSERLVANVSGSSILIPLGVVAAHGFMDLSFFLYGEDVDFCFRLLKRGIPSYVVPRSVTKHTVRGSSSDNEWLLSAIYYYKVRNTLLVIRRYRGIRALVDHAARLVLHHLRRQRKMSISQRRIVLTSPNQRYVWRAILDAFIGRTGKTIAPEDFA